jgi:hypothetical protein
VVVPWSRQRQDQAIPVRLSLGALVRRLSWLLARAWRARPASKCRARRRHSTAAYLTPSSQSAASARTYRHYFISLARSLQTAWTLVDLAAHAVAHPDRIIKQNQAGRVRLPQHDQLPTPNSEPHCIHPTAIISTMNGTISIPSASGRVSRRLNDTSILRIVVDGEHTLSPVANLFWNAREGRLRAGWRVLVFLTQGEALRLLSRAAGQRLASRAESIRFQRGFPGHLGLSFSFVLSFAFVVAAFVFLS